jgi:hypothetical protein
MEKGTTPASRDAPAGSSRAGSAAIDTEPGDAFYGYTGPGYTQGFWILDVEGTGW